MQQIGILVNHITVQPSIQAIAGVRYRRWFGGLGAAIDPVFLLTVPLFADARFTFIDRHVRASVYGNLGKNQMFYSEYRVPEFYTDGRRASFLHHGWYHEFGISTSTRIGGNLYYLVSAGLSYKSTEYTRYYYVGGPGNSQNRVYENYDNRATRFSLRMGLQF
jgi:hypothetical protein